MRMMRLSHRLGRNRFEHGVANGLHLIAIQLRVHGQADNARRYPLRYRKRSNRHSHLLIRRLEVKRDGIVNAGANALFVQSRLHTVTPADPNYEKMPDRFRTSMDDR